MFISLSLKRMQILRNLPFKGLPITFEAITKNRDNDFEILKNIIPEYI